jgi:Tfp pilus assembly protein PilO
MNWGSLKINRQSINLIVGFIVLILVVIWILKIRNIQRIRNDIVQLETKLSKGQDLWKNFPPLSPKEKADLQKTQERLFRALPKEKDVPSVLQEVSRVAREYNLENLSLNTSGGTTSPIAGQPPAPIAVAPQATVSQPTPSAITQAPESSETIDSFPIKLTFSGDYREIAYFLESLQKIPRVVTIQSLQLQRGVPFAVAEVVLKAYYQKGDFSVKVR